jgi:hypothetical protein
MQQTRAAHGRDKARPRRALFVLAVCAGLAVSIAACGGAPPPPAGTGGHITASGPGGAGGGKGERTSGSFSLSFARCMRVHGVPGFPDPDGKASQLGPGSGFDPDTPRFQSALNGPCRSLAPPGWLNSGTGPVTR